MLRAGGLRSEVAVRATSLRHGLSIPQTACARQAGGPHAVWHLSLGAPREGMEARINACGS